jgi:peptide/nickel transport system permease protein
MNLGRYLATRALQMIPVLLVISAATFFLIHLLPGDVVVARLGPEATPDDVARLRTALKLDDPLVVQYLRWLWGVVSGDPGTSLTSNQEVGPQRWRRLPVTLELVAMAMFFAMALGIPMGVYSALRPRSPIDYLLRLFAVLGQAVPNYWVGIIALTYLSIYLGWVPPTTYKSPVEDLSHNVEQFVLPALITGYALAAVLMRFTRASMITVLNEDYVRTARSKGLSTYMTTVRHVLRNALIPMVTLIGIQFATLIGGTVIIESVFSLPGVGTLTVQAVANRDYEQIQLNVLAIAIFVVVINMLIDASYLVLDPRVRRN